jgi:hypothetical protein
VHGKRPESHGTRSGEYGRCESASCLCLLFAVYRKWLMSQGILSPIFCGPSSKLHSADGENLHIILFFDWIWSRCSFVQPQSVSWHQFIIRNIHVISVHLQWIIRCLLELQYWLTHIFCTGIPFFSQIQMCLIQTAFFLKAIKLGIHLLTFHSALGQETVLVSIKQFLQCVHVYIITCIQPHQYVLSVTLDRRLHMRYEENWYLIWILDRTLAILN